MTPITKLVECEVNDTEVSADCSLILSEIIDRLGLSVKPHAPGLRSADGKAIETVGTTNISMDFPNDARLTGGVVVRRRSIST
jgi:hypothetical protein